jgi:hypothetical protein
MMRLVAALTLIAGTADAAPSWPKVVTQSWLSEFAAGKWPIATLVDPKQGLIVVHYLVDSGADDYKPVLDANRLCGADIEKRAKALQSEATAIHHGSDTIECHNRPSAWCSFHVAFEYSTAVTLEFHPDEHGDLRLDTIMFTDAGGNRSPGPAEAEAKWMSRQLARLTNTSCEHTK